MNATLFIVVLIATMAASSAFYISSSQVRPSKLTMLFNFGKKPESTTKSSTTKQVSKDTYIPAGLTPAQYQAYLKAEDEKKLAKKTKFPRGKVTESLTEWMAKNEEKGIAGKDLNLKGHRMVKTKYEGWYTDESPI
mmetsp:Transcript_11400/g.10321  ORF Transcript_11400/g.10321 Transcript_11400/m.10321 type:complete len:136 (+) Transcript_11400:224-631(+)